MALITTLINTDALRRLTEWTYSRSPDKVFFWNGKVLVFVLFLHEKYVLGTH